MWGMIRKALGLTRLEQKVDTMNAKVSDVKASLDGIASAIAPLPDRLAGIIQKLVDLQNSANNPVTETRLTAEDQALLDSALAEGTAIQNAVAKMAEALPAPAAPPSTEPPPADTGTPPVDSGTPGGTEPPPST